MSKKISQRIVDNMVVDETKGIVKNIVGNSKIPKKCSYKMYRL